ncbi:sensor domain-containing diguanylate cyclase [Sphingobium amiense]|uniref:Sensor domain-containing diguanylate cyclase n=1 Tax=Sphingobium amiense TaxID=135719 RepID=A0A494W299_9SPHN|nr:GGDEF domain-containing protein [Sphingobium amiense]BBD98321.1 sensor domain-containing diguanylate cyclase [Sphingobium amiense]
MSRHWHEQFSAPAQGHDVDLLARETAAQCYGAMEAELARARRRFDATFHHAPVGMAHVGLDGSFLLVNPRFCAISGYDADTLIRTGFQQITHPDDLRADEALLTRLNAGELPRYSMEKRYIRADGAIIWVNLTVAMARDEAGEPDFYVAVIEDLSELRQASFEAIHDPLTGLLNRRGFASRARDRIGDTGASLPQCSLVFLDLDGFKQLNDREGHGAGDACLVEVARLLRAPSGESDLIARLGGDEFVLLMLDEDADGALHRAQRLCTALAGCGRGITGSIGLAVAEAGESGLDSLIARADTAMLTAKRAGKNQVRVAVSAPA